MRVRSVRLAALAVCALYFPLVYCLVYVPLIVPRLAAWRSIPLIVLAGIGLPFVVLVMLFGSVSTQHGLILGVIGIAAANALAVAVAAGAGWPGFHDTVGPFSETLPAVFVGVGVGTLVLGEVGFALRMLVGGRSRVPDRG